ncbi:methyltransferase TYW3-domain-containing protein [Delphinella strobiligena]|nr:methyltransferase TYW3-domain-containing protein [Delphinella strobiligena]
MPSVFESKKAKILEQLAVPDSAYHDASPKGSVDVGIRDLVDQINVLDTLVTTSSCAGRIAVYLEGRKKGQPPIQDDVIQDANAGAGGKGGGRWLFVSHDPLVVPHERQEKDLTSVFGMSASDAISIPSSTRNIRWVRCKFEPMILHVLCSSIQSAQRVQNAAMSAGFRESGISSITSQSDGSTTAMTAVRTTGLAFDSVVGYEDSRGKLVPMVDEAYMNVLVELANERFAVNTERSERFRKALIDQFAANREAVRRKDGGEWETADIRKARMRAEGLARKAAAHDQASTTQRIFQDDRSTADATGLHAAPS